MTGSGDAQEDLAGQASESPEGLTFPIVGVGASAGGLAAFKSFVAGIRPQTPAAYVLIQHLDPDHQSFLAEILQRESPLPVEEVTGTVRVQPRRIYVIRPNTQITVKEGHLHIAPPEPGTQGRSPIDIFFRSLAESEAEMAVGVVLSGTGSDGTLGLKAVKAHNGMTLAQSAAEAEFPGMPENATAHDYVDFVLGADEIPARIDAYFDHREAHEGAAAPAAEETERLILRILSVVRAQTGQDFRHYKRNTIVRRVQRRMSLRGIRGMEDYLERLREKDAEEEVRSLAQDLLISVTNFFRDPGLWNVLENEILPELVEAKGEDETIRVWVPGCATGEEAYSYAILLSECVENSGKPCRIQVYATDIDDRAREFARRGIYPATIEADMSAERLARFFSLHGESHYEVSKKLRERVIFARQDLVADPPFSRMDLVSCRNLLIYLSAEVQEKVLGLMHFALCPEGVLVLGTAERLGKRSRLFSPIAQDLRIFRKQGESEPGQISIPTTPPNYRGYVPAGVVRSRHNDDLEALTRSLLIQHLSLGCVLVDSNYQILFLRGDTHLYLRQPEGSPTRDLLAMVRESLRPRLRQAIRSTLHDQAPSSFESTHHGEDGLRQRTKVTLTPIKLGRESRGAFIVFEAAPAGATLPADPAREQMERDQLVRELEEDLRSTREQLQGTVEDLESSNEELKASNEEILSINEELQSSNEELETSKEELQSLNEELTTLNAQLEDKVHEVERTNNDLNNLITSTAIAVLFLDREFRVQRYTSASASLFHLIPSDIGRPLAHLVGKLEDRDLLGAAREVMQDLRPREDQVQGPDDRWFLRRILPYRTQDSRIEGVVVVFNDVSTLKKTQAALEKSEARFRVAIEGSPITVFSLDAQFRYQWISNLRISADERGIIGKTDHEFFDEAEADKLMAIKRQVMESGQAARAELEFRVGGKHLWWDLNIEPVMGDDGKVVGLIGAALDITERELQLRAIRESEARFRTLADNISQLTWMAEPSGRIFWFNKRWHDYTGLEFEEVEGWGWMNVHHPDEVEKVVARWKEHLEAVRPWEDTFLLRSGEGEYRWFLARALPILDERGQVVRWFGSNTDITDRIHQEEELRHTRDLAQAANRAKAAFLSNMSHDIRTPLTAILGYSDVIKNLLPSDNARLAELIKEASERLMETLESVLNLSRLESDQERLKQVPLILADELATAHRMFAETAPRRTITLERKDSAQRPVVCRADRSALHRVVDNLLSNAVKFTARNGRIAVTVGEEEGRACFTVADDGEGISPQFLPHIFDAFTQERGKSKKALGGSGLGMAITKQLVTLMEGDIRVESTVGQGTTVKVFLPVAEAPPLPAVVRTPESTEAAHGPKRKRKMRILLCEDYEPTQRIVGHLLDEHRLSIVSSEEELLRDPGGHDLILLDVNLNGEDIGYTLLCKLKADKRHVGARIVAFTAHNLPGQREEFLEMGFDDFLPKPFSEEDLLRMVYA